MTKETLFGQTPDQLARTVTGLGMPRFTARQLAEWFYKKGIREFERMTNISARNRALLAERFDQGVHLPARESISADGTRKYLFETDRGRFVESAYIPDGERATLCVSSQAGCRMGCRFCMTARQGFQHHLSTAEILNQILSLPLRDRLTNLVYMGMGEPLDNPDQVLRSLEILTAGWGMGWSPTRITLSTAGILPSLKRFLDESRVHLAVSLHNPFAEERARIMPVEKMYPIEQVVELLRRYDFSHQRRVSFEYIVMSGLNDSPAHIKGLTRLLAGLPCRINLIRFHKIPESPFFSPGQEAMEHFRDELSRHGIITTIRASRGEDIQAACGLLSTREQLERTRPDGQAEKK